MWTHRLAVATSCATFVLLLIGGIVHGTGSSLACPDWPLCFGSFFPEMKGNVLIEHGHRLFASGVGVLTVVLFALLFAGRRRGAGGARLWALGLLALVLVCFQGLLGGLTVIYRLPTLVSSAHLATSMLFFALLVVLSGLTGAQRPRVALPRGHHVLLLLTTLLAYTQIALGGLVRHTGAGLACIDLPLCRGQVLPIGDHPTVLIHALHRLNGLLVFGLVIALLVTLYPRGGRVRAYAVLLAALVLGQLTLGVMSVLSYLGLIWVTAHLGGAALCLAVLVRLCMLTRPHPAGLPVRGGSLPGDADVDKAVTA